MVVAPIIIPAVQGYVGGGSMRLMTGMVAVALFVSACGNDKPSGQDAVSALQGDRPVTTESLFRGVRLFQQQCAQCHGPEAQGHPDWRNPKVVAAPPLNGTGNEWKRRKQDMIAIIKNGAKRNGEQIMPAWKGRLSDQDIEDIITWFQALWPADVYHRWLKANADDAAPKG